MIINKLMKLTSRKKTVVVLQMLLFSDLNIREHSSEGILRNKIYNLLIFKVTQINIIAHLIMILSMSNKSLISILIKFKGYEIPHRLEWEYNFLIKFREILKQGFRLKPQA